MAADDSDDAAVGELIGGRYRVEGELGRGGVHRGRGRASADPPRGEVVVGVARAVPGFVRGVQDLSCTGRDLGVAVCIAVGVAQALTPHGVK